MSKKALLRLTYIDEHGEAYHEQVLSPKIAIEVLARADNYAKLYLDKRHMPLGLLTAAEVRRCRTVTVKLSNGCEVLIEPAELRGG